MQEWNLACQWARAKLATLQPYLVHGVCTPWMGGGWNVASMMPALNPRDWIFELNPWGATLATQKWQLFTVHWIDTMENCSKPLLHAIFLHHWAWRREINSLVSVKDRLQLGPPECKPRT